MRFRNMTILLSLSILAIGWFVYSENKSDDFVKDENTETSTQTDTDGDGVVDSKDHCPDVAGKIDLFGCNDTDGDGISDELEQNNGTNPNNIDTDGDGVNDKFDQCPIEKGTKKNNGCKEKEIDVPIPPVINDGDDDVNKMITISYMGVQYTIRKGFTTKEGMKFNNFGWRYYKNKWENENKPGSRKWKAATTNDINFVLAKNAKKIDSGPLREPETTDPSENKQKLSDLFIEISNGNFISKANKERWKNLYFKLSTAEKQDKDIKKWNRDIENMYIE
jgi:hypothetical protein